VVAIVTIKEFAKRDYRMIIMVIHLHAFLVTLKKGLTVTRVGMEDASGTVDGSAIRTKVIGPTHMEYVRFSDKDELI